MVAHQLELLRQELGIDLPNESNKEQPTHKKEKKTTAHELTPTRLQTPQDLTSLNDFVKGMVESISWTLIIPSAVSRSGYDQRRV